MPHRDGRNFAADVVIIGNLLLVTGMAMLAGGWHHKKQEFNKTGALAAGSTLLLSAIALIIPAIFRWAI